MKRLMSAVITAAFVTSGLVAGPSSSAFADDDPPNSPPVTAPDKVTIVQGSRVLFNPLVNDTDPDGDKLELCGQPKWTPKKQVYVGHSSNPTKLEIQIYNNVKPVTIKYWACDWKSSPRANTITVKIKKISNIKVVHVKKGKCVALNPNVKFNQGSQKYGAHVSFGKRYGVMQGNFFFEKTRSKPFNCRGYKKWWAEVDLPFGGWVDAGRGSL